MTHQPANLTVVTGASSGIGAGRLRTVADSLDPAAPAAELVLADLADPAGVEAGVAAIGARPG